MDFILNLNLIFYLLIFLPFKPFNSLAVLVVLYFGLGAVYQWKFKEAQTFPDFIIHREFWFAIPGLVKDGALFIAHGFKKGDYTSI